MKKRPTRRRRAASSSSESRRQARFRLIGSARQGAVAPAGRQDADPSCDPTPIRKNAAVRDVVHDRRRRKCRSSNRNTGGNDRAHGCVSSRPFGALSTGTRSRGAVSCAIPSTATASAVASLRTGWSGEPRQPSPATKSGAARRSVNHPVNYPRPKYNRSVVNHSSE